ncbi:putative reverse transcriptase zinc-binding domain-containing protein [Helianthus annuus]|nr:putative reverse transcriptase zinc-binding domain-containing protein [Helianthus annuus]
MEALTCAMNKATSSGLFNGIKISADGLTLSHLSYADDVMFIGDWSITNINNLRRLLRCFYLASGLKVNLAKCSIYGIGVSDQEVQQMASYLRCKKGTFPFIHLGLPIGANMNLARNWKSVVDVFRNRLSIWKAKTLSYGGRITLIKSVLNSLPTYYLSLFKAPAKVLSALDKIRRVFFWGGSEDKAKMNWVAWEKTIAPVEFGGLGFGSIRDTNLAMLAKWWWRFKTEKYSLWRRVVWALHHNNRVWNDFPVKVSIAGPWKGIMSIKPCLLGAGIDLSRAISAVPVNGESIQFWLDAWADPQPLYAKFPNLFKVESNKTCRLADRMCVGEFGPVFLWAWTQPDFDDVCQSQLLQLISLVSGLNMGLDRDLWKWQYASDGVFCVAGIKKVLSSVNRVAPAKVFKWNNWVPKKVSIVAWRAAMERLPTKCALASRNISVQNNLCVLCGDYAETSEHLFVACQFAQMIWQNIADWCNIPPIYAFDLNDVLFLHETCSSNSTKKKVIHAVILTTIWSLWKLRNDSVFNNSVPHTTKILDEIKAMAFLWVRNRAKMVSMTWGDWSRFNI